MDAFVAIEQVHYDTATVLGVATTKEGGKEIVDERVKSYARPDLVKDWSPDLSVIPHRKGTDVSFYVEKYTLKEG